MSRIKPELLAPAGDFERMKWAFMYGADAVYIGGPAFGLRANAINFSLEEIKESITYAHSIGKKVYITANIALHNEEGKDVIDYLKAIEETNADAVIVSDPYIMDMALKYTKLTVHISTQASTMNIEALAFFKEKGVERVIMAREVSKDDLRIIKDNIDLEIETFIHGAMCASISGRCVLSNFLTARDANRGGCSQICRWNFNLTDGENDLKGDADFTFCTKDLIMLDKIPELIDLGIASLKIEGRMRSIYYIATVVSIYRKAIDKYFEEGNLYSLDPYDLKLLNRCANREMIPQFFDTSCNVNYQYYNGRDEMSNQDFLGVILEVNDGMAFIEQRNYFEKGDIVEVFGPNIEPFVYHVNEIFDEDMNIIEIVRHPLQKVYIRFDEEITSACLIRKKIFDK